MACHAMLQNQLCTVLRSQTSHDTAQNSELDLYCPHFLSAQAYYVIKAAQEREALQREGDALDARIRTAEKEVAALEATLAQLMACNSGFAQSFKKVGRAGGAGSGVRVWRKAGALLHREVGWEEGRRASWKGRTGEHPGRAAATLYAMYTVPLTSFPTHGSARLRCSQPNTHLRFRMSHRRPFLTCLCPQVSSKEAFEERSALREKLDRAYDKLKARRADEAAIAGDIQVGCGLDAAGCTWMVSSMC